MSDGARYRQRARDFEQRENWKRAIEAYELAIQADKRTRRDVDLTLYNRVGDLYRRVGDIGKAVHYYELAVDGHLAAGFYNNAIALCNKILRNQPNRHSAYLKLGKIGAAKGFLSDARKHFLEYAERMQKASKLDQAFAALIEFANLSPDPEVRLMIADQLLEHDRTDMAVEQLRLSWRDLKQEGRDADAQDVRARIMKLAPNRDPEVDPPEEDFTAGTIDAVGVLDLPEILPYDETPPPRRGAEPAPALEEETPELQALDEAGTEGELVEADLEIIPTSLADTSIEAELDGGADRGGEASLDFLATSLGAEDETSAASAGLVADEEAEEATPSGWREVAEPIDSSYDDWPTGETAIAEPDEVAAAEPPEEPVAPVDRVAELEARLLAEGRDPGILFELGEALLEIGEPERGAESLREAADRYEAHGALRQVDRVLDELLRLDLNDVRSYQKRVELASKSRDRSRLIEAYLDLADCLDRTDAGNKARTVYTRVLELEPDNHRATAALEMLGAETAANGELPGVTGRRAAAGDYVDLGTLVLEEEERTKSTRFTVPTSDPQSEDDVNFSEMLDQFKSKVAEAIEKEDASSHYDLGCAFRDMGLIDEAVAEFQIAARTITYRLRAIEMLGACFLDKEDYRIALKVLSRALQVPGYRDEELVGIFYALGFANEALGHTATALEWYERVIGCDVGFKDAAERVSALRN